MMYKMSEMFNGMVNMVHTTYRIFNSNKSNFVIPRLLYTCRSVWNIVILYSDLQDGESCMNAENIHVIQMYNPNVEYTF